MRHVLWRMDICIIWIFMTTIYFVRHAEPEHNNVSDRDRPLTPNGLSDSKNLISYFVEINIDKVYSSPYKRSFDTVRPIADYKHLHIIIDERFRERKVGIIEDRDRELINRWNDFNYAEPEGESLSSVQTRTTSALKDVLAIEMDKSIIIGIHGTALSTIINYYDKSFGREGFLHYIDLMPYVLKMEFNNMEYINRTEEYFVHRPFALYQKAKFNKS
jgi:2,3-bisphosphoglycerate-dependent phosphoglycerate mutase